MLASTADSFLDLLSGSIVWLTERAMQKVDLAAYPAGRTRLEPVGVVVFATMMGMATLQLLSESVKELLGSPKDLTMGPLTVVILGSTILLKFGLYLLCAAVKVSLYLIALSHTYTITRINHTAHTERHTHTHTGTQRHTQADGGT